MMVQIFSSVIANVYNEYLLKDRTSLNLWVQNIFMYGNGFILNLVVCLVKSGRAFGSAGSLGFFENFQLTHYLLILNQVFLGICASLLLKHLNSIVKALSTAIEMSLSAILQWMLLDIAVTGFKNYLAFLLALLSIYLYALNPIVNELKSPSKNDLEKQNLLLDKE